jgi:hypothetical protein
VISAWPTLVWPAPYAGHLHFDWHSGLWEFDDAATVRFGREGCGFGAWHHVFHQPAADVEVRA